MAVATARSAAGSLIFKPPTTLTKTSCSERRMPTRRVSTAAVSSRRLKSTPFGVRRGFPNDVGLVNPWISTSKGRVPSIVTTIADPGAFTIRSARKASEGLVTSVIPRSPISKTPTSDVAPKRFLTDLSSR